MTPLQSSGQVGKAIAPFGELAFKPDIRPDVLFRLTGKLQSTLELPLLIEIFFKNIQSSVSVDGISYRVRERQIVVSQGRTSAHSVNYELSTHGDKVGELIFFRSSRFPEYELANIEGLLSTLLHPLRNALLYQEALDASFRDSLTGAGNRVALDRTLDREIELSRRHEQQLSLLMLDLDNFKSINDQHGHSSGDAVLKETVRAITDCMRQTDLCFRYGGEEFLILLSNASQADALIVADRIRETISKLLIPATQTTTMTATASIGCASLTVSDSRQSLIHRADLALYTAKNRGRNCVVGEATLSQGLMKEKRQ
ncbi:GGDEF domain-containing protein [Oceanobacter antarcticus]|uniref:diguanylate cyclase n=1 Tax=Oceanobacter antarcticus TaxID=3133425 RepID=A0ABW8NLL8_9GAMM